MQTALKNLFPSLKFLFFTLLLLNLLSYPAFCQYIGKFDDKRPTRRFAVINSSPYFEVDLDYDKAFEVNITSFNGEAKAPGFCEATPSEIRAKLEWTGVFPEFEDDMDNLHSYDNIVHYEGYYFILDSITYSLLVTKDVKNIYTDVFYIPSTFENDVDENGQFDEPFMVVDTQKKRLLIITGSAMYSYSITAMLSAIEQGTDIPVISTAAKTYKAYESILNVVFFKGRLYIVADNAVDVYKVTEAGDVDHQAKFDAQFFGAQEMAVVDIALQGKYAFVLDKLVGMYVVDISNEDETVSDNEGDKFIYVQELDTVKLPKADFIEVIGNSLNIISPSTKNPFIQEYIINGNSTDGITGFEFNRKIEMFQSLRDTYSDGNFLYILTGFFNMVVKHSIPGKFNSQEVNDYLSEYWPLFGAKAMVSVVNNETSKVVAIQDEFIAVFTFSEGNPILSCNMQGISPGLYTYTLKAVQSDCVAKEKNTKAVDFKTICEVEETIELLVTSDGSSIGDISMGERRILYLMIGSAVMGLIVLIFMCLCRKYKNQYRLLEDQIKFHKIVNESGAEVGIAGGKRGRKDEKPRSEIDLNPDTINIQAELEKAEAAERAAELAKAAENKPHAEFGGDIKPLDIDEIYGKSGGGGDSSF
jgi:hypothetical protein